MLKEKNNLDLLEQTINGAEYERRAQRASVQTGAFNGMYHIFDHHKSAVTAIHFANNDKSLFACCSADGNLSICQLLPEPATVIYTLKGHTSSVSDFKVILKGSEIFSWLNSDFLNTNWLKNDFPYLIAIICCHWSVSEPTTRKKFNRDNSLIVSSSSDTTTRLWCTRSGKCLRVIQDPTDSPVSVCCFQPTNNNMGIIGNHKGEDLILIFLFSN